MEQNLHQTQTVTVIALIIFALIMIAIGIFSARKTKTMDGFLLGGRKIGAWVSAFAYIWNVIFFSCYFCRLCGTAWLEHRFGQYLDRHR